MYNILSLMVSSCRHMIQSSIKCLLNHGVSHQYYIRFLLCTGNEATPLVTKPANHLDPYT